MSNVLSPNAKQQFFDNNGRPAVGYKLFTYAAGTTTKLDTYVSESGAANTNPIVLDYRGECNLWIPPNVSYKYVLAPPSDTDPPTAAIWTTDDVVSSQLITLYGGVDTGSANAYVLNFTSNFSAYTDGIVIYWIPSNSNTTASTLNVNGLGVVPIVDTNGDNLNGGEIVANQITQVMYLNGEFVLITSTPVSGSFTGTLTGITGVGPFTGTANYSISGKTVCLRLPRITDVSNSTACTLTGMPTFLTPNSIQYIPLAPSLFVDNGALVNDVCAILAPLSPGVIIFAKAGNASGFTAANDKGINESGVLLTWALI